MRARPASPPVPATAPDSAAYDTADFPLPPVFPFTPVPSASPCPDGCTPERQRGFVIQLARIGMVSAAARAEALAALRNADNIGDVA